MFRRAAPLCARVAEAPCACILHVVPSSCSVSFMPPSVSRQRDPVFARIACARVRAGERIARLIARASRTPDAPLPSVPNTVMHSLRCPESKRRPRKPPLLACSYLTTLFPVSSTRAERPVSRDSPEPHWGRACLPERDDNAAPPRPSSRRLEA